MIFIFSKEIYRGAPGLSNEAEGYSEYIAFIPDGCPFFSHNSLLLIRAKKKKIFQELICICANAFIFEVLCFGAEMFSHLYIFHHCSPILFCLISKVEL